MSKIDHKNFLTSTGEFAEHAAEATSLAELQARFAKALRRERVIAFDCEDGFGIGPAPARRRIASPAEPATAVRLAVDALDGNAVTVTLWANAEPDAPTMARLHLLAVLYVTHALVLAEADGAGDACGLGADAVALQCVWLARSGLSYLEIGERFGMSPQAVGIQLRRAAGGAIS